MAPSYRENLDRNSILARKPRLGGVLLLLLETENDVEIVFTRRMEYAGVHSGQISFPGGKVEEQDSDFTATALRETEEEIGVGRSHLEVLGTLSELYIPPSNFLVYPTVAAAKTALNFKKQDREVKEIFSIPLSYFFLEESKGTTPVHLNKETVMDVPAYVQNDRVIWGATAIILSEFLALLHRASR